MVTWYIYSVTTQRTTPGTRHFDQSLRVSPTASGTSTRQVRPPFDGNRFPFPDASDLPVTRRTAQSRAQIIPVCEPGSSFGYEMTDPYVRRFWVAAIGPGAVADLLRLAAAAQGDRSLRTPVHLSTLLSEGLVRCIDGSVIVPDRVPPLPRSHAEGLAPRIRQQFVADLKRRRTA